MRRLFVSVGSFLAGLAVILGAFGTHALRPSFSSKQMDTWHTGTEYHLVHAIALILVGVLIQGETTKLQRASGLLFITGIVVFGGSLYLLALTSTKWLGAIAPLGGLCLILGWISLGISAYKSV